LEDSAQLSALSAEGLAVFCRNFASEIKRNETSMNKMTPNNKQIRRHQEANLYTEEQARLLFAMRDMVKWEVQRQLSELLKSHNY